MPIVDQPTAKPVPIPDVFDVFLCLDAQSEFVFAMRAPIDTIAAVFVLRTEALSRLVVDLDNKGECSLYGNNQTRGAWGNLGPRGLPLYMIQVRKPVSLGPGLNW